MNDTGRAAYRRAVACEAAGAIADAAAAYDELVAADPGDIGAWSVRGQFLERQRRFAEACESFRRSTAIRPTYADHYNAGRMLAALARTDEALVELDAAVRCEPVQADGWCQRGVALLALGRFDEARTSFDRALALDDKLIHAYHCKAMLLQKLGDKGAVAARRRIVELAPSAVAYIDLANALRHGLGDTILWEPGGIEDQIVSAVERALEHPCDHKQAIWCWAEKLVRLQRLAHGRQAAHRAGIAIDDAPAIERYLAAAEAAAARYATDRWFADKLAEAQLLAASLPR